MNLNAIREAAEQIRVQVGYAMDEVGGMRIDNIRALSDQILRLLDEAADVGCKTCENLNTNSYKFYTYPCNECKYRARDSCRSMQRGKADATHCPPSNYVGEAAVEYGAPFDEPREGV